MTVVPQLGEEVKESWRCSDPYQLEYRVCGGLVPELVTQTLPNEVVRGLREFQVVALL